MPSPATGTPSPAPTIATGARSVTSIFSWCGKSGSTEIEATVGNSLTARSSAPTSAFERRHSHSPSPVSAVRIAGSEKLTPVTSTSSTATNEEWRNQSM